VNLNSNIFDYEITLTDTVNTIARKYED